MLNVSSPSTPKSFCSKLAPSLDPPAFVDPGFDHTLLCHTCSEMHGKEKKHQREQSEASLQVTSLWTQCLGKQCHVNIDASYVVS